MHGSVRVASYVVFVALTVTGMLKLVPGTCISDSINNLSGTPLDAWVQF